MDWAKERTRGQAETALLCGTACVRRPLTETSVGWNRNYSTLRHSMHQAPAVRDICWLWACSSALNCIRWGAIFLHRAFQRLYRSRLTLHQPPLVEENLNRSPSRLGPVDGSCGAANSNFCKQLLGYSRVSAAEELRGWGMRMLIIFNRK